MKGYFWISCLPGQIPRAFLKMCFFMQELYISKYFQSILEFLVCQDKYRLRLWEGRRQFSTEFRLKGAKGVEREGAAELNIFGRSGYFKDWNSWEENFHYICCSSPLDSYSIYKILLMNERVNAGTDSFHSYLPAASLLGQVRSLEVLNKKIFLFSLRHYKGEDRWV